MNQPRRAEKVEDKAECGSYGTSTKVEVGTGVTQEGR
jgi:hypothetical protein